MGCGRERTDCSNSFFFVGPLGWRACFAVRRVDCVVWRSGGGAQWACADEQLRKTRNTLRLNSCYQYFVTNRGNPVLPFFAVKTLIKKCGETCLTAKKVAWGNSYPFIEKRAKT